MREKKKKNIFVICAEIWSLDLTLGAELLRFLGFEPGLEFKVAIEEAQKRGAKLVLGDVPVEVLFETVTL